MRDKIKQVAVANTNDGAGNVVHVVLVLGESGNLYEYKGSSKSYVKMPDLPQVKEDVQ